MFFHNVMTLWKKELRSYLYTPVAAFFIGIYTSLLYGFFYIFLQKYQSYTQARSIGVASNITIDQLAEGVYNNMHFFMVFLLPFFTFRLFTEESRQNTLVLLMTSPIRSWELVLAKFKASLTVLLVMLLVTSIFPLYLYLYSEPGGGPDMGIILSTYLGLFLVGCAYMAMGLFFSSITESVLVALILSFIGNLFFAFMVNMFRSEDGGLMDSFFGYTGFQMHVSNFLKGTIELKAIVYFLSFCGFFLFLSNRSIESRSWRS
ncbi:ABC transporter permease subunit [bacterium]|nr:ABC transporter permease subunit [bacterium]